MVSKVTGMRKKNCFDGYSDAAAELFHLGLLV